MDFSYINSSLFVSIIEHKGRGVFTQEYIFANTVIEKAPVIVFDAHQRKILETTDLFNYIFEWGEDLTGCCVALGLVSIYNHASPSNCEYVMDFETSTIIIKTVRDIQANEELTINYSADWNQKKSVWFKTV